MDKIKKHFEEEAKEFDQLIVKLIPYYEEMIDALVSVIPFDKNKPIRVIDLGCGTGTIAKRIKEKFPNAKIICLDLAENMIERAKAKLQKWDDINYIVSDFYDFEFVQKYDIIISSLAIHHLKSDKDKKRFFREIFKNLHTGGMFYNADAILASSNALQKAYMEKWKEFMLKRISLEEIETKWIPKYQEEDSPAKLTDQLNWLTEIGFKGVDIIWKYYNFAVYGGIK